MARPQRQTGSKKPARDANQTAFTEADLDFVARAVLRDKQKAHVALAEVIRSRRGASSQDIGRFVRTLHVLVRDWRLLLFLLGRSELSYSPNLLPAVLHLIKERGNDSLVIDAGKTASRSLGGSRDREQKAQTVRAVRESIPDWLDELGAAELGGSWDSLLRDLNSDARMFLRVNALKTQPDALIPLLKEQGVTSERVPGHEEALMVEKGHEGRVFRTESFKQGLFEVQDLHSQHVSHFADLSPGLRVVDACAGEGGKTLHMSSLLKNKGRLIALDAHLLKLNQLRKRAARAGCDNIEVRHIDRPEVYKRLRNSADRVLLDVPCSGLGVLRRHPEIRWQLTKEQLDELQRLQAELLLRYAPVVRRAGELVYATCSVLPSEGEQQIQAFLKTEEGRVFEVEEEKRLMPAADRGDGFYMARLVKVTG